MSNITFGGLATGLDTNSIIDQLLKIERQPIDRLETRRKDQAASLDAAKKFDTKLDAFFSKVDALDSSVTLISRAVSTSTGNYLSGTAYSTAVPGSYEIKVGRLAQVEKAVFTGVADKATTTFGTGTLLIDNDSMGAPLSIGIDSSNNTLQGIRDAINLESAATGVTASIINDGGASPYRLVLTGAGVANANISLDGSGLTGGATFPTKDVAVSRAAQSALVQVDGITITSDTNTLAEAIPGVTIALTHADPVFDPVSPNWNAVESTTMTVSTDKEGIKGKVAEFVSAFNDLVKAAGDTSLAGDSGVRAIMGTLRGKFVNTTDKTGLFTLGIKTLKEGTLQLDQSTLDDLIDNDLAKLESVLAGDDASTDGIADRLKSSLDVFNDALTGFMAGRQKNYDAAVHRIDKEIERGESRLARREQQLIAQFAALEQLVSALNNQGSYLTQQMQALSGGNN